MKWNIVLDSSCDLSAQKISDDLTLKIVPLTILVGDKDFRDDESLDTLELLEAMKAEKSASSSACPSPDDFFNAFKDADYNICITMTGALSGTFNAARLGKEMLEEEYPDKKVHLVDSQATAGKMVLLQTKAQELIQAGCTYEETCEKLDEYNKNTNLVFALGGYDNLIKTGRMSHLAGVLAKGLGIRAVAEAVDGQIEVVKKPRGEKKAVEAMIEIMKDKKPMKNMPVVISHCNNPVGAQNAKEMILQALETDNIRIIECRGLTSFYTMKNGLIIGY